MNAVVDTTAKKGVLHFDLADENNRLTFISWLKQLLPSRVEDQMQIDKTIIAAGGTPEPGFPGYEVFQQ